MTRAPRLTAKILRGIIAGLSALTDIAIEAYDDVRAGRDLRGAQAMNRNRITMLREHEGKIITAMAEYHERGPACAITPEAAQTLEAEDLMRGWVCEVFIPDSSYHQRRATATDAYGVLGDMLDIAIEAYDDVRAGR